MGCLSDKHLAQNHHLSEWRSLPDDSSCGMQKTKRHAPLPIGRTARVAFEIDGMRAECSKAAQILLSKEELDDVEFDECARLDEALARAHAVLKSAVRNIMLSRIHRKSRAGRKK
jgi:hypothetical protein